MLLTEEQTKQYLNDMIEHYEEKESNTTGVLSWQRSEAEYRRKTFEDMRIVLFGDDNNGYKRAKST
ncbi:uncharacterized protein METZ01_LOCUS63420 [marine metagenome]|uniref:Uncharacterized protein n=1 Tax=marine metagenome TaxID=408172 RepID=A0A381T2Y0_9ZZZZ